MTPGAGDISSCHLSLRNHSVFLISIATGEPSVRPWRTPPISVSSSCSNFWRGPAAVAEPAAGHLGLDVLDRDLQPGRQPLDDDDERLAVRFAGGEEAEHPGEASPLPATERAASSALRGGPHQRRASGRPPGPQLAAAATAWWTSMPSPSIARRADARGRGEQRRLERVVDDVGDDLVGAQQRRVERESRRVAHADRRRVDDERRRRDVVDRRRPGPRSASRCRRGGRASGVRLTIARSAAPARAERVDDRPRRAPAPSTTDARVPPGRRPTPLSDATKPSPSVLCAEQSAVGAEHDGVDRCAAPRRPGRARRRQRRRPPCAASSPTSPPSPSARIAASAAAAPPRRHVERDVHASRARAPRTPALCSAGDRLCRTGEPITAGQAGGGRDRRCHQPSRPAGRAASTLAWCCSSVDRERVAAVLVGEHVVQVDARLRRVGQHRGRSGRPAAGSAPG